MNQKYIHITDQIDQHLTIKESPKNIISLVPSITFLLAELGLNKEVAGITRFCKLPKNWKKEKTIVGGTKDLKIERIKSLKPELIILNKEENTKENFELLKKIAPVYVSEVANLEENKKLISDLGKILNKKIEAGLLIQEIDAKESNLKQILPEKLPKAAYFIWKKPWMSVGGDTFINYMLQKAGFQNVYKDQLRYPEVKLADLSNIQPEVILLSSEPYPFKEKDQLELQKIFPKTKILLVEGEAFTWFGAYPKYAFDYFKNLQKQL